MIACLLSLYAWVLGYFATEVILRWFIGRLQRSFKLLQMITSNCSIWTLRWIIRWIEYSLFRVRQSLHLACYNMTRGIKSLWKCWTSSAGRKCSVFSLSGHGVAVYRSSPYSYILDGSRHCKSINLEKLVINSLISSDDLRGSRFTVV